MNFTFTSNRTPARPAASRKILPQGTAGTGGVQETCPAALAAYLLWVRKKYKVVLWK